jgi:RNA polymerase sigma factor (TIGR02999 family)
MDLQCLSMKVDRECQAEAERLTDPAFRHTFGSWPRPPRSLRTSMTGDNETTRLLEAVRDGDREAFDRLYARVYAELREIARQRLRKHRPGETLNTTALVHEAYLRLADQAGSGANDRSHFLALASRAMRFVLVDYARARSVQKRGGGEGAIPLDLVQVASDHPVPDLLALNDAMERLRRSSDRQFQLVEYRFFGGMNYEEIANVMDMSVSTAKREWTRARTWLYTYMQAGRT